MILDWVKEASKYPKLGARIAFSKSRRRELFVSALNCSWLEKKLCCHFELFLPICATRCRQPEYLSTLFSSVELWLMKHFIFGLIFGVSLTVLAGWCQVSSLHFAFSIFPAGFCILHFSLHFFAFCIFPPRWPRCSQFCCFPSLASWAPAMSAR